MDEPRDDDRRDALAEWTSIATLVRGMVGDLSDEALDLRADANSMTIRETAHHIVEANVVAASIVIAALGSPGSVYDWSWMLPFGPWMTRMRYDHKPLAPSLSLLESLNEYVRAQIEPLADGLERTVQLRDEPGGKLRTATVAEILLQEAEHARHHVEERDAVDRG